MLAPRDIEFLVKIDLDRPEEPGDLGLWCPSWRTFAVIPCWIRDEEWIWFRISGFIPRKVATIWVCSASQRAKVLRNGGLLRIK